MSWERCLSCRSSGARGRLALWWLLLSEWPSLLLIYSSLYTGSCGTRLIFTSTGDTELLIPTPIPQFMAARTARRTVSPHIWERDRPNQLHLTITFVLNPSVIKCTTALTQFGRQWQMTTDQNMIGQLKALFKHYWLTLIQSCHLYVSRVE